jgi:hypothetical protein
MALGAIALGGVVLVACEESPLSPVAEPEGEVPAPAFALVLDSVATPRGPLLKDLLIAVPDSGAASGVDTLWTLGQLTAPAVLELVGGLDLERQHLPGSAILTDGVVLYYRDDGELMFRFVSLAFIAQPLTGWQQWQPPPYVDASDSLVLVDTEAASHGMRAYWSVEAPEAVGYNFHTGGPPPSCPLMISWNCYPAPSPEAASISATPPQGTLRLRAFSSDTAAAVTVRIDTVLVANETSFTTKRGEDTVTVRAVVTPASWADSVRWLVRDAGGDSVLVIAPAAETLGRGAELTWVVPAQDTSRWRAFGHPGTLGQKALAFEIVAQVTDSNGVAIDSVVRTVRQDEVDTMREEYVELVLRRVPARDDFSAHVPCGDACVNTGDYGQAVVNAPFWARLDSLRNRWTEQWQLNSLYRNPVHHIVHRGFSRDSWHPFGCAADLQTFPRPRVTQSDTVRARAFWRRLAALADSLSFRVEPIERSGAGHVHVELRCL